MKPTCAQCGGLGWVDSYGHIRHDAPGAYDHLFKRREKVLTDAELFQRHMAQPGVKEVVEEAKRIAAKGRKERQ